MATLPYVVPKVKKIPILSSLVFENFHHQILLCTKEVFATKKISLIFSNFSKTNQVWQDTDARF